MLRWLERLRQERSLRALRAAALSGAALAFIAGFMAFGYELAAARVPAHRAALEALVRAQTGLDLRFEELALQWGWYGPEAVFSRIELGEPGGAAVLLKAPALIVGFDAWRTLQSGALQAGRITLVAPDIDLARLGGARDAGGPARAPRADLERLLARWRDGRIDLEGGSLRIASDPRAPSLALAIRRATFYRAANQLSIQAYLLLPERLGASARIELRLRGDLNDVKSLAGRVRLEGAGVQFGAWRELLARTPQWARLVPAAGAGEMTLKADIAAGRLQEAAGSVHAGGVEFAAAVDSNRLVLDRLRGDWRLERRGEGWHGEIEGFEVGRAPNESAPGAHVEVDAAGATFRASASALPLAALGTLICWLAPLDAGGVELSGTAQDVTLEWDGERAPGARLRLVAKLSGLAMAPASQAFTLSGIDGQLAGDERAWAIDLRGAHAGLAGARPAQALADLNIATHLLVSRAERGWRIAFDALDIQHERGRLHMSGSVSAASAAAAPLVQLQGELADADVTVLQQLLGDELIERFGAAASRLKAGRIETARFALNARAFSGAATLRDAIVADVPGLDAEGIAARIDWSESRVSAAVDEGRAGPLTLGPMQLQWRIDGKSPIQIAGHASGRLENTLSWVRAHAQLAAYVPTVKTLAARGDALFDFDFALSPDVSARSLKHRTHAHVAIALVDASVVSGPGMPPLEGVRGALAFDGGHLQHSLLTARWLGGPVSLKVAERAERGGRAFVVKAQGVLDVRKLAALGTFADPAQLWGEAEWSGDFVLSGESSRHAAQWQAHLDSTLTGITSALPEPLTKAAGVASLLHIEIAGSSERAFVRCALADRLHSVFEISAAGDEGWRVERGSVRFGGTGPLALTAEPAVVLSGELARLEPSPYVATWNRVRRDVLLPSVSGGVFVSQLLAAGDVYPDAHLTVRRSAGDLDLKIEPAANRRGGT